MTMIKDKLLKKCESNINEMSKLVKKMDFVLLKMFEKETTEFIQSIKEYLSFMTQKTRHSLGNTTAACVFVRAFIRLDAQWACAKKRPRQTRRGHASVFLYAQTPFLALLSSESA